MSAVLLRFRAYLEPRPGVGLALCAALFVTVIAVAAIWTEATR